MSIDKDTDKKKYRPCLTLIQMKHILSLCKADTPLSSLSVSIIKTLGVFVFKVEEDIVKASYTLTPQESLLEQLTGEKENTLSPEENRANISLLRLNAYNKLENYGEFVCTDEELSMAHEHKVTEKLLTEEELQVENDSWDNVDMSKYMTMKEGNTEQ